MRHDRRPAVWLAAGLGVLLSAGCEVTNPGPVQDDFLVLQEARAGFVNGAKERLTRAVGNLAYNTALPAREIFPGGQTGSYGNDIHIQAGNMEWDEDGPDGEYNLTQQARWIAEEAIRRLTDAGDAPPALLARAYIWAGYANRLLGENWCEAVIDGGPLEPGTAYFERAEEHFTNAIAAAPDGDLRLAAYAGRAQVRLWLEDWTGAAADAAMIGDDRWSFDAEMDFSTGGNPSQRNHLYFAAASTPYRSYTVRFTFFDEYYTDTGDPRTPWIEYETATDTLCVGGLQGFGAVPCTRAWKYRSEDDDIRLASGREMRLIEAEVLLRQSQMAAAVAKINGVRTSIVSETTGQPLTPYAAASMEEAWTALKRERAIELWLEGRRMGDLRRWEPILGQPETPGSNDLPNFEALSNVFTLYPHGREVVEGQPGTRVLCYNISNDERNTNPNIPDYAG